MPQFQDNTKIETMRAMLHDSIAAIHTLTEAMRVLRDQVPEVSAAELLNFDDELGEALTIQNMLLLAPGMVQELDVACAAMCDRVRARIERHSRE